MEHKLGKSGDLDQTILRKVSQECSVSTRMLSMAIDIVIQSTIIKSKNAAVTSSAGSSGDVLMEPPSGDIIEKNIKLEYIKTEPNEMTDYSSDILGTDSIFNQMKRPEAEFGRISPVQKRPTRVDQNSNVEFGKEDLSKTDNPATNLNLSDANSRESNSNETDEAPKITQPVHPVNQSEPNGKGETVEKNGGEISENLPAVEKTPNPGQAADVGENITSIQSQPEMSDESESELYIDAGDSSASLSPKKMLTSPKKAKEQDFNDYWKNGMKNDIDWKDQDSFEVLIADITSKRSKPAFARVVALGRIQLGLHDDVSKIISSDMLKFILKCHQEQQFHTVELKIQQLIKGMGFSKGDLFSVQKACERVFPRAVVNQKPGQN